MDTVIAIAIVSAALAVVGRWAWRTARLFGRKAKPDCACAANRDGKAAGACAGCPAAAPDWKSGRNAHTPL